MTFRGSEIRVAYEIISHFTGVSASLRIIWPNFLRDI